MWPNGYGSASFRIRASDIITYNPLVEGYTVLIKDGLTTIYQGRLERINKVITGVDEYIECEAQGWIIALQERYVIRRWVDDAPLANAFVPESRFGESHQGKWEATWGEAFIRLNGPSLDETFGRINEGFWLQYNSYAYADKLTYTWQGRTGEGFNVYILDTDIGSTAPIYELGQLAACGANGFGATTT